jgi:hypothetical protein
MSRGEFRDVACPSESIIFARCYAACKNSAERCGWEEEGGGGEEEVYH